MTGLVMLGVGALLLVVSGGYYAYAQFAKIERNDLVHTTERPGVVSPILTPRQEDPPSNTRPAPQVVWEDRANVEVALREAEPIIIDIQGLYSSGLRGTAEHPAISAAVDAARADFDSSSSIAESEQSPRDPLSVLTRTADGRISAAVTTLNIRRSRVDLGNSDNSAQQRDSVSVYEDDEDDLPIIPRQPVASVREPPSSGHMVAEYADIGLERATAITSQPAAATRISVPGIGVRSLVEELEVIAVGDRETWETPKHVVGHIPTTPPPGSGGHGWYFGHLESPIRGEGNVFLRLPELAERFKDGERFTINLDADDERYIYQVYKTEVVHQSELAVTDTGLHDITLVACWPQYVYSERILVTAALVDVVEIPEDERVSSPSAEL